MIKFVIHTKVGIILTKGIISFGAGYFKNNCTTIRNSYLSGVAVGNFCVLSAG